MPEIGSDAWIDAFARAVADVDAGEDTTVSVAHRILDGPSWLVLITKGAVRVERLDDSEADITMTWERGDAVAVASGELTALVPFQAGRLRVEGDLNRLAEVAGVFARFPAVQG